MPEMVRLLNRGPEEFKDGYANVVYRLPVNQAIIVPWAAATLWFGDPAVIDKPTLAQFDRRDEIERVYQRMGCYDGDDDTRKGRFDARRPNIEVQTLDGDAMTMLVDAMDGTGQVADVTSLPRPDEREALASELERMKAMQAELLSRLNVLEAGEEHFDDLPTDTPTQVPVDH